MPFLRWLCPYKKTKVHTLLFKLCLAKAQRGDGKGVEVIFEFRATECHELRKQAGDGLPVME